MISFRAFLITEEQVRKGVRSLAPSGSGNPMTPHELNSTMSGGKIHFHHQTEKQDGSTGVIGYHPDHGFYTQNSASGSDYMTKGSHYEERARRRSEETGKPHNPEVPKAFGEFHEHLTKNKKLQDYLKKKSDEHKAKGGDGHVRIGAEFFVNKLGHPSEGIPNHTTHANTPTPNHTLGHHGKVVLHSALNPDHDPEEFKKLGDENVKFHHDIHNHKGPKHVDVSKEKEEHDRLMREKGHLFSERRTKSNSEAKDMAQAEHNKIAERVAEKVHKHIKLNSPGEGNVVHPSSENTSATRFKVLSPHFKEMHDSEKGKFSK